MTEMTFDKFREQCVGMLLLKYGAKPDVVGEFEREVIKAHELDPTIFGVDDLLKSYSKAEDLREEDETEGYTFLSSHGKVRVNAFGRVTHIERDCDCDIGDVCILNISRFDVIEMQAHLTENGYPHRKEEDILNAGYWTQEGDYIPADDFHRQAVCPKVEISEDYGYVLTYEDGGILGGVRAGHGVRSRIERLLAGVERVIVSVTKTDKHTPVYDIVAKGPLNTRTISAKAFTLI